VADSPLVLAANRDELYARPTRPPEVLVPGIVGGVDAQSGGTWLALDTRRGRFAAVTNQRALGARPAGVRSRGLAVLELAAADDQDAYVDALDPRAYASMNLAWGGADRISVAYLRHDGTKLTKRGLPPGIHVMSNDQLESPAFPRTAQLAAAIRPHVRAPWPELAQHLRRALADHAVFDVPPPPHQGDPRSGEHVIDSSRSDGELASALTATCIHTPVYGTRSSSIVAFEPGRIAHYLHADGPPCTTPFADLERLLA
jgi:uncharacterized protein with NRDE domain